MNNNAIAADLELLIARLREEVALEPGARGLRRGLALLWAAHEELEPLLSRAFPTEVDAERIIPTGGLWPAIP